MPAHGRVSRTMHAHASVPTPRWHSGPPATSAPRTAHAATTYSCVPRLYPLRSCYAEATFFSVSSLLASALLLPCESAVATISRPPYRRLKWEPDPPPSPPRIALRSSSHRGPPAPELAHHWLRFLASPATIDRRLRCSSGPVDPASSIARARRCSPTSPTEPMTAGRPPSPAHPSINRHRRREPTTVSLPPLFAPNRDHRRPGLLPGRFPADQRLPTGRIWPVSHRRRGEFFPPLFHPTRAEMPKGAGPLGRAGLAVVWAEPKCTVPFFI
jgi:hypothetical protein